MNELTPVQALQNLYNATRLAPLKAEEHEFLVRCAKVLDGVINPPQEVKEEAKK